MSMIAPFRVTVAIGCLILSLGLWAGPSDLATTGEAPVSASLAKAATAITQPQFKGEWIQGSVLVGQTKPHDQIQFLGRDITISKEGFFVIGLGRDFPAGAQITVSREGHSAAFDFDVQQRSYKIQRIEGVPNRTVNPDPSHLTRIRKESAAARSARKAITDYQYYRQAFQWPLRGPITGVYGSQRYYNGQPRRPHFGVDVAAPTGTVVRAPADGTTSLAYDDMFFSGGTLILDHGHGLSSSFLHLSKILVTEGETVKQGQPIAEVGATGRVTGPHLDWRMNWYDQRVDPQTIVPSMADAMKDSEDDAGS